MDIYIYMYVLSNGHVINIMMHMVMSCIFVPSFYFLRLFPGPLPENVMRRICLSARYPSEGLPMQFRPIEKIVCSGVG